MKIYLHPPPHFSSPGQRPVELLPWYFVRRTSLAVCQKPLDKSFYNFAGSLPKSIPGNVFFNLIIFGEFLCVFPMLTNGEFLTWALMDFIESLWRSLFLVKRSPILTLALMAKFQRWFSPKQRDEFPCNLAWNLLVLMLTPCKIFIQSLRRSFLKFGKIGFCPFRIFSHIIIQRSVVPKCYPNFLAWRSFVGVIAMLCHHMEAVESL